jgi:V8-like Glu-specific endopeptidase
MPAWVGTGFLVANNLVMTCNHVLKVREDLRATTCQFNYQLDVGGRELPVTEFRPDCDGPFLTDANIDFSVFALQAPIPPSLATPVRFARRAVREGQRVAIIQHAGGRPKQISFHQNSVTYADERIAQYITSTEPGSSGAPVFDNASFEVVALHNKGGFLPVPGRHGSYLRNEAASANAILARLQEIDPELYRQLTT